MVVTILSENVKYPEFELNNPNGLNKGFYLSKCKSEILFQLPLLKSRSGIVNNAKNEYIDLVINENIFIKNLISYLETRIKEEIKKKQNIWFSSTLLDDDINYYFLDFYFYHQDKF